MEVIRIKDAKEYCEAYGVERNDWVSGAVDKVLACTSVIQYRNEDGHLLTIDIEYINSHMQSLKGWDNAINKTLSANDLSHLRRKQRAQAGQTIGELADDFEIGIA